ncbi:MAG TPA: DUF4380 domain-containing protein [Terriglobia bacterium]|nr:DUF4380 domain-containing protein [Terriglobia bacterium]
MSKSKGWIAKLLLAGAVLAFSIAPGLLTTSSRAGGPLNLFSARLIMASPASPNSVHLEKAQYKGWNVYRVTNGIISLYIAPEIGGRAIQLELGGKGLFFVNQTLAGKVLPPSEDNVASGWANYGGDKVWPAPEGWNNESEWVSIPYYNLDGSQFSFDVVKDTPAEVAVRVTSPKDERTGVQFERTFHVYAGTTRVTVDQVMKNISLRQIRWGIWHLIQNDAADANDPSKPNPDLYMYVPVNPHSMFPRGYYIVYGDARHPSYQLADDGRTMQIHYLYRVGKVAMDSSAGWYAVVNGQKDIGYVETFKHFSGVEYPDNASVESWNDGVGTISRGPFFQVLPDDPVKTPYFLESEVLSPYATLDPGEQYEFTVHWSPTSVTNPIVDAVWGGAISQPLSASVAGARITLKGVFGVFVPGDLVANFYSPMGEILSEQSLEAVDPRQVARLDKTVDLPPNAYRVSVFVRDANGRNRGYLGNVILKGPPSNP